jgi:hypothetical protein
VDIDVVSASGAIPWWYQTAMKAWDPGGRVPGVIGVIVGNGDGNLFGGADDGGLQSRDGRQKEENDRMLFIVGGKILRDRKNDDAVPVKPL